jgi:hypothetical protein
MGDLVRHGRRNGCYVKKEGVDHFLWCNPKTGQIATVPKRLEIPDLLVRRICRVLSIPETST